MRQKSFAAVITGPSAIIRAGLTRILIPSDFRIIASASFVDEALLNSLPHNDRLLLIIDIGITPAASVEQMRLFKKRYPAGRIAVLANEWRLNDVLLTYRAGASAYLTKISASGVLLKSLELAILGDTAILPPSILSAIRSGTTRHDTEAGTSPVDDVESSRVEIAGERISRENGLVPLLSEREEGVLRCLLDGNANKVIARRFDITEAAVKFYVKSILRKFRVHNRTQAAILAMSYLPNCLLGVEMPEGETDLSAVPTSQTSRTMACAGARRCPDKPGRAEAQYRGEHAG
jgi:two-component system, NarL family, nitrate/nitrite response regulator NarL